MKAALCLSCGARLWKTRCRLEPRFRNKKKKKTSQCDASTPVEQMRRNSSTGVAAMMTQQSEASLCLHTTGGWCVCLCEGLFVCVWMCLHACVGIHNSFILLLFHSMNKAYNPIIAHRGRLIASLDLFMKVKEGWNLI